MQSRSNLVLWLALVSAQFMWTAAYGVPANSDKLAADKTMGTCEIVAEINEAMPTGVAVSKTGRIFLSFPRWCDELKFTVGELKGAALVPYPDVRLNNYDGNNGNDVLVSVQSVVVDKKDRLWVLDTGSVKFGVPKIHAAKLLAFDLSTNKIVKKIVFSPEAVLPTTYLNDIRIDLNRGKEGVAFITDSASSGPNAIIVVDLNTGHALRRLPAHPSTQAERLFMPIVEGQPVLKRTTNNAVKPFHAGSDGIALSANGKTLFYCPLSSRKLYSVNADALCDTHTSDYQVARTIADLGEKGASDGLECDSSDTLYATNYETNSILRKQVHRPWETLVHDSKILWPDTLALSKDGYLYFTVNQLHRMSMFHNGKDLREKPYLLMRTKLPAAAATNSSKPI